MNTEKYVSRKKKRDNSKVSEVLKQNFLLLLFFCEYKESLRLTGALQLTDFEAQFRFMTKVLSWTSLSCVLEMRN